MTHRIHATSKGCSRQQGSQLRGSPLPGSPEQAFRDYAPFQGLLTERAATAHVLPDAEVLAHLDGIAPGFRAWADSAGERLPWPSTGQKATGASVEGYRAARASDEQLADCRALMASLERLSDRAGTR